MNTKYTIKNISLTDLPKALAMVWQVFKEFQAPDYSKQGVTFYKEVIIKEESVKQKIESGALKMYCTYNGNDIIGVIATRAPAHISFLFVDKRYHRQGIAKALFNYILNIFKHQGAGEVTVNSSPMLLKRI